ncbi:glycoside hydrolase family 88 protein [uncultured Microbulbifer sp.]|uniref:glycoside hydrolase family 88 protein n=1 Tax=uncultured Microbulbifer sp. TaxID=348147 RepID=UPI0025D7B8DC|nr:glycoside hydrolase family 88 protein [uncultured Microbulbifer sp.]
MNNIARFLIASVVVLLWGCGSDTGTPAKADAPITPDSVKALTKKVADWQIETFDEEGKYRALPTVPPDWMNREQYHDLEWHHGALYAGMNQWRKIADDPKYTEWLRDIGERNHWKLHQRPYHADDHTVGQFYLSFYEDFNDPAMLNPVREQFDWILQNPKTGTLDWEAENTHAHDRWGWCDALFMAPPVWARLAKVTGDQKYLEFMDREYRATYDLLWSEKDHLFWRDSSYFTKSEKNGEDIFWARGNGWVFGGLALMIPDLPATWEHRDFYLDLYKKMAKRLRSIQREDGTWSMGLLGGVEGYPIKETSGTAFYTFGLAWGINQGILDRETYEPTVMRAWQALAESVTDEGLLGYVQPVGAAPGDSFPDYTEVYGVGAFLAAGSELYKMLQAEQDIAVAPRASPVKVETFMHNGGWCWFQDPRAIVHDGKLVIGGVAGNGGGEAVVGVYDLKRKIRLGRSVLHQGFDKDDHNAPVFYPRRDGSLLTVYARHSIENKHYTRISDSEDYLSWGEEKTIEAGDPATYMNLFRLGDEDTLYNFYRGIQWNPTFVTSGDDGNTWGEARHFIQNEVAGVQRPYARYAGNGADTVGVSFTDAHPRDFGNSIYYAEFRNGSFYRADGTFIKNLEDDGPLKPSEAEKIFQGGGGAFRHLDLSANNSAWTSDIAFDDQGHPHIAYTLYLSNTDQRYRLASWDGKEWHDREIAFTSVKPAIPAWSRWIRKTPGAW